MRGRVRVRGVVFSFLAAAAAVASAQAQVVTKAAPEPTNAPKAFVAPAGPDAEALLLSDRWTLGADGAVVHERTQRIRVNSSLAINRDFGESRIVWDPAVETFEVLHNRTVLPSGEVVPGPANAIVDELPPAVHRNPLWSTLRRKVIVHTALEPGAVIEASWRVTRAAAAPAAMTVAEPLAYEFPVAERTVEVTAPASVELAVPGAGAGAPAPECATSTAGRTCRWRLTGVAALGGEPGAPPAIEMAPYALAAAGAAAAPGWAAAELQRRWDAAGAAPADAIAAARKAAAAEPDRERALLAALAALGDALNISGGLTASQTSWTISPLANVWSAGWASPLEMAALAARVLGELGYDARPGLLLAGPQAGRAPGFALHERAVIRVRFGEDSDIRLCDPREPAAERPLELAVGAAHVVVAGTPADLTLTEAPWKRRLVAALTVDEKGAVKGELSLAAEAGATPHAALVRDPQKLAERLAGALVAGAKVTSARTTRLERGAASLAASFEGTLPEKDGRGLVAVTLAGVAGGVTEELPPLPGAGRFSPVGLPGPGDESLEVTLKLPKGWTIASPPVAAKAANGVGEVVVTCETAPDGAVTVRRRIAVAVRQAPAADAAAARALLVAWGSPASRVLLLRPPAAK
jgi:hypothetical protein